LTWSCQSWYFTAHDDLFWPLFKMHEAIGWGRVTYWLILLVCGFCLFPQATCILNFVGWCWCELQKSVRETCFIPCSWRWHAWPTLLEAGYRWWMH
jgi:hypothetical protein